MLRLNFGTSLIWITVFGFVLSLIFVPNISFGETDYKRLSFKLAHDPVICMLEIDDKNISEAGKKLTTATKYAILDWQTKLQDTTGQRKSWNFDVRTISLKDQPNYNYSNCDIQIHFLDEPKNKEYKFSVLGVTYLDEQTKGPIIEIYYKQWDPGMERQERREGNIIYYWYEYNPHYLNLLRTDDQLASVIRHELGHSFGLGHYMSYDHDVIDSWKSGRLAPPTIMIPISPDFTRLVGITPLDIEKMVSIYGRNGFGNQNLQGEVGNNFHTIDSPNLVKTYESSKYGFSIQYPADWQIASDSGNSEQIVSFIDNPNTQYGILDVMLEENDSGVSLTDQEYLDSIKQNLQANCESTSLDKDDVKCYNLTVFDSKTVMINNNKGYQVKYYRVLIDNTDVYHIINIEILIPKENQTWILNAVFDSALYSDFGTELENSINSFKLISDNVPINIPEKRDSIITKESGSAEPTKTPTVPAWIKNNAKWWSEGQIEDSTFINGIQFLIKNNIISISQIPDSTVQSNQKIPDWIRNNAKWWADGQITEHDFLKGIEHLVKVGIIKVK